MVFIKKIRKQINFISLLFIRHAFKNNSVYAVILHATFLNSNKKNKRAKQYIFNDSLSSHNTYSNKKITTLKVLKMWSPCSTGIVEKKPDNDVEKIPRLHPSNCHKKKKTESCKKRRFVSFTKSNQSFKKQC